MTLAKIKFPVGYRSISWTDVQVGLLSLFVFLMLLGGHYLGNIVNPVISFVFPLALFAIYFVTSKTVKKREIFVTYALFLFYLVLFVVYVCGNSNEYGGYKVSSLLFSLFVPVLIFLMQDDKEKAANCFLAISVVFFFLYGCAVLGWKLYQGQVFERTLMGFNGPIVFARMMIIGLLSSLFLFSGVVRFFLSIFFIFMAMISFSKGPVLSLLFVGLLFVPVRYSFLLMPGLVIIFVFGEDIFARYINFFHDLFMAIRLGSWDVISGGGERRQHWRAARCDL